MPTSSMQRLVQRFGQVTSWRAYFREAILGQHPSATPLVPPSTSPPPTNMWLYDDEKQPILGPHQQDQRWKNTFKDDEDFARLNRAPDDFGDVPGLPTPKSKSVSFFDPHVVGLSLGFLALSVGSIVGLPVYIAGLVTHNSDPFGRCFNLPTISVLLVLTITLIMRRVARGTYREISLYPFFLKRVAVYGLLTSLGLVLQGFCGVPSRTPAYIQAVSAIITIPAALFTKYAIYRKSCTSRQMLCLLTVVAALVLVMLNLLTTPDYLPGAAPLARDSPSELLISQTAFVDTNTTLSPTTTTTPTPTTTTTTTTTTGFATDLSNGTNATDFTGGNTTSMPTLPPTTTPNPLEDLGTVMTRTLWSMGFALGYAFHGVAIVFLDEPIRLKGGHPMVVCLFGHLMTFSWIVFMFFFDLIPTFGWATYLSDFRLHLHRSIKCLVGADSDCAVLAWRGWLDIFLYTGFSIAQCYLLNVANCPVYVMLVAVAAVPFAALTWSCLADTGLVLLWNPSLTPLSIVLFLAMLMIIPAAYIYRHLCHAEQKEKFEKL